jgi:hypothetical protein
MKKVYLLAVLAVITFSGCTAGMMDYMERHAGESSMVSPITPVQEGTLFYKASPKAKQCLKDKVNARGYWMLQDEVDCWDNAVK